MICPTCNSLAIGDRCAQCGHDLKKAPPDVVRPALETPSPTRKEAGIYLKLEPSEQAVLAAASRIVGGFAAAGTLTPENEQELAERAVRLAARMALVIERYVQSDNEDW